MVTISAINARGHDLRPARNTDLVSLVQSESQRNSELSATLSTLRREVDELTTAQSRQPSLEAELAAASRTAGLRAVAGPAVSVTLRDAPLTIAADGIDQDLLVVHQQDIQSVANALWRGGAEAMTIQGQRVISTTGIKCVGNTVVLHGIPYAPPYVVVAVGNQERMQKALDSSEDVRIYRQYVAAYGLGYDETTVAQVEMPAMTGSIDLRYASATPR